MTRHPGVIRAALLALAALGAGPIATARADFTPYTLVSGSSTLEADYASAPAISADGRYVVYVGSQAGVPGIYRKNLQSGELDLVASGKASVAGAPSISADGRYVSFSTTAKDPGTGTGSACSTVYRADLLNPRAPVYALVSAPSDGSASLTYAGSGQAGCPGGGSSAAGRVAISADGSKVAFTVVGRSDLQSGIAAELTTPGAQVAVRNLTTDTTTLVSQTMSSLGSIPQAVPEGAAMTDNSTGSGKSEHNADPGDSSVAISADGSTVAWLGINIPTQAPAAAMDAAAGYPHEYDEPLWRRIADGPAAPTRRVIGGDDPACGCSGPLDTQWEGESAPSPNTGPERGSFIAYDGFTGPTAASASTLADASPQLSANGQTVAILSTAPLTGQDPACITTCSQLVAANAYLVNMAPGLTRSQALTQLTAWASNDFTDLSAAGPLAALAISPEGDRVAFVTRRTAFPYSPPALITPQLSQVATQQLYVADLAAGTLDLVSTGYDGQPANGDVVTPDFSAAGGPIAFASSATNLVFGAFSDSTPPGDETFTTTEVQPTATPGLQTVGPAPSNPAPPVDWVLSAFERRGDDGRIIDVSVPGGGRLDAAARAAVPKSGSRRARARLATRTLARANVVSHVAEVIQLHLRASARYRRLISGRHGLYATVTLTFTALGHRPLHEVLPANFARRATNSGHDHTGRGRQR